MVGVSLSCRLHAGGVSEHTALSLHLLGSDLSQQDLLLRLFLLHQGLSLFQQFQSETQAVDVLQDLLGTPLERLGGVSCA